MSRPSNHGMPGHWAICHSCSGHGGSSAYLGAYTREEFEEAFGTPEEQEAYMRGDYDRPCECCGGSGKVWIVNVRACTFAEKRELVEQRRSARWEAEERREQERESRMLGEW